MDDFEQGVALLLSQTWVCLLVCVIKSISGSSQSTRPEHLSHASSLGCVEREVGGGIGMGNICKSMADSCQCMTKTTTIL